MFRVSVSAIKCMVIQIQAFYIIQQLNRRLQELLRYARNTQYCILFYSVIIEIFRHYLIIFANWIKFHSLLCMKLIAWVNGHDFPPDYEPDYLKLGNLRKNCTVNYVAITAAAGKQVTNDGPKSQNIWSIMLRQ